MSDDPKQNSHFRFDARPYATRWSTDQQIAALRYGTDWLQSAIDKQLQRTRWDRYRQLLESHVVGPLDLGRRREIGDALRSGLELYLIARACEERGITPDRVLLGKMVSGVPGESKHVDSAPWDAQHELLSLAMVIMSGIKDVRLGEPDVVIGMGRMNLGIPVKRVTRSSSSRLQSRLRECVRQTRSAVDRGFAIFDIADPTLELAVDANSALEPSRNYLARILSKEDPNGWLLGFTLLNLQFDWIRTDLGDRVQNVSLACLSHLANVQAEERTRVLDWLSARGQRLLRSFEFELARLA